MPDELVGIQAVTILVAKEGAERQLEDVMEQDYLVLSRNPAFLEGRLVRCPEPGTYLHITHWLSADALTDASQDPEVKNVLAQLPLASPREAHRGDIVMRAQGARVVRAIENR